MDCYRTTAKGFGEDLGGSPEDLRQQPKYNSSQITCTARSEFDSPWIFSSSGV